MTGGDPVKGWMVIAVLAVCGGAILYTLYQWIQLLRLRARLKRENPDAVAGLKGAFRVLGFRALIIMVTLQGAAALLRD